MLLLGQELQLSEWCEEGVAEPLEVAAVLHLGLNEFTKSRDVFGTGRRRGGS